MGVGSSYERSSVPMRPVRVVETTVEDTVLLGEGAIGMVESDIAMVVAGRRSPRKKSAKKSPAKKSKKKSPAKKSKKKSPAKKSAKKSPAKKSAKKSKKMKMYDGMHGTDKMYGYVK